ncbi:MAG: hypothetical protein WC934_04910 [Acidithiobacillus sp.]|jgi:hypothetical protein|uniref:hypothetical protein n=1 Tax=Acidithiobacillus sp. TaxID=1872118 RepID=UPI003560D313
MCKNIDIKIKKIQEELKNEKNKNSCIEIDEYNKTMIASNKCKNLERELFELYNKKDRIYRC